ncbi:DUF378 domain-containing protein [Clostridium swellfunianum]|uniref:DUF378 domain-containing protein n=1 Tax=Clostridium swellfunianum TaxID=1367462 RepID=UPI0020308187|nr:DUF378 domain-containing protein [Clostridium swellfunianum]MCM0648562.1 DUF378 domain-containing protein [Clostridium swellfunianum]
MYKLSIIDKISFILVIIGALNWGLVGLFNFDLVQALFGGSLQVLTRILYILVGVAGIDVLSLLIKAKSKKFK